MASAAADIPRPFYRVSELAALVKVSDDLIHDEINDGRLVVRRLRRLRVVTAADLAAWVATLPAETRLRTGPKTPPAPAPSRPSPKPAPKRRGPATRVVRRVLPIRSEAV
jgi:hypothetical protein